MAPHDVGLAFGLEIDASDIDWSDVDAGVQVAERFMRPRLLEALNLAASATTRRAKVEHRYKDRTGALTKSIHSERAVATNNGAVASVVADAPHAAPIHNGSRRHVIAARNAKALAFFPNGGGGLFGEVVFRRAVMHPGTVADAFLDDAAFGEIDFLTDVTSAYATEGFREAGFG